jgi:uncharacterized protein YkwD
MQRDDSATPRRRLYRWLPIVLAMSFWQVLADKQPQALALPFNSQAGSAQTKQFDTAGEAQLVELLNQERRKHGLQPLIVDERLTIAARKHTELMAQHSQLSHQFEGEPPVQIRFSNESLPSDRQSENVALNNRDIASAHDGLMHSPPHRQSILDPDFNVVGVGVLRSGEEIYVTEDFARKLPEYSEPQAEASAQAAIEQYAKSHRLPAPGRRPQLQLRHMACTMALYDALDGSDALRLPGVHGVLAWTADDPANLPKGVAQVLTPQISGYSLGACFAPSVSHPGGVYWVVMVTY